MRNAKAAFQSCHAESSRTGFVRTAFSAATRTFATVMHAALLARRFPSRVVAQSLRTYASKPPSGPQNPPAHAASESTPPGPAPDTPPSALQSLDFTSTLEDDRRQRTGAKSSKDSLSSIEKKRRILGRASLMGLLLGVGAYGVYLGREWEEDELKAKRLV
jgi:mitochondrial import inner membrane translocase subunit TIM50